jgi:radical SAM superfamily enzyme YgiQ (UPF0313 family)
MKKVLLLNPPADRLILRDFCCGESSKAKYYWPPADLLVLSGILWKKFNVQVLDANVLRLSFKESLKRVLRAKPDSVIFLTSAVSMEGDFSFVKKVKEETGCSAYTLGDIVYFKPKMVMEEYPFLDGIIFDFTSQEVVKLLEGRNKELRDVAYRQGKKIILGKKSTKREFEYPVPRHELFPLKMYNLPYARYKPVSTVLTNYGCPYNCAFCASGKLYFKQRKIDNLIKELEYVQKLGIKEVFVRDLTFAVSIKRGKEICRKMIGNRIKLSWTCEARVDTLDEELIGLMKRAGCHLIMIGVESASDLMLRKTNKAITLQRTKEIFNYVHKKGITTLGHFIIGLPEDTRKSINDTIKLAKDIGCDYASINLYVPRLGSDFRNMLVKEGKVSEGDLTELDCSADVKSVCGIPKEELLKLHKKALVQFYLRPGHMLRLLTKIRTKQQFINLVNNGMGVIEAIFAKKKG